MSKTETASFRIQYVHLHPGNSSRKQRKGSKYMTLCKLWTKQDEPSVVATGVARCNTQDAPSRRVGREVSLGRALKAITLGLETYPEKTAPKRSSLEEMVAEEQLRTRVLDLLRRRNAIAFPQGITL